MTTHLRYSYQKANIIAGESRHAKEVMAELGITYQHSTPKSVADQFWFWNCEGVPAELPKYITELKNDPMECIGWGLDEEMAIKIRDYERINYG